MRVFSTDEERKALLKRLNDAPDTEEIRLAIRIVEEAMDYADLRDAIEKIFDVPRCPQTLEEIFESKVVHHEMRPFCTLIDEIHRDVKLQKFRGFYFPKTSPAKPSKVKYDEEGFIEL